MNGVDQEMQQNGVSNNGDDSDDLAEDKKSLTLKGEESMLSIKKLGQGGDLEGRESIVRESDGMEVEEDGHCLKEGESHCEDEDGHISEIGQNDDSTEEEISTKSCITPSSKALQSSEESTQHEDEDAVSISVISSDSDFEVGSLPFKRRKRVCVHNYIRCCILNHGLCI